ncbi:MAG: hypothetical protein ABSH40_12265 [Bryobacteraceae bacterium]
MSKRLMWRKGVNAVMLTITGIFTVITVATLFLILGYLVYYGSRSLNWNFFTKLPLAAGEEGGGMANAMLGSLEIVGLAGLIGLPVGFLAGVYLSEFPDKLLGSLVRYVADLLNGIPSIVVGLLAWSLVVVPMKRFSAVAGSIALSVMLIPVVARQTEQFLREVPLALREGEGNPDGNDPRNGPHFGRVRASAVYRFQQSVLERGHRPADGLTTRDDLLPRPIGIRRLAPAGLGRRPCFDLSGPNRQYPGPPGFGKGGFCSTWLALRNL